MIHIRPERPGEEHAVHAIHRAAFPDPDEADLVRRLRSDGDVLVSLVAEGGGALVGHVLFSPVSLEPHGHGLAGAGLAPLAVAPPCQGRGIGTRLCLAGIEACRETGQDFLVVLGSPGYYARFGFRPAARYGLTDTWGGGDAFQVLELKSGALAHVGGTVHYAPAFGALVQAAS
jgi:putative acetyltransferase